MKICDIFVGILDRGSRYHYEILRIDEKIHHKCVDSLHNIHDESITNGFPIVSMNSLLYTKTNDIEVLDFIESIRNAFRKVTDSFNVEEI